ncbi:MAG TPA: hypothetical protein VIQ31_23955 [Phormidium sp.]
MEESNKAFILSKKQIYQAYIPFISNTTKDPKTSNDNKIYIDIQNDVSNKNCPTEPSTSNTANSNLNLSNSLDTNTIAEESESQCNNQDLDCFQNSLQHEVKLLKLLNNLGTPLYAYNEIMKWAYKANMARYNFDTKHKTYHQVIRSLEDLLGMQAFRPETKTVTLKGDNKQMEVVVFNVPTLLASLFNDTELNQDKNLVLNANDRFGKYVSKDNKLGEINSGHWYETAYKNLITDPENDFLCPLILASDKTTLSEMGDLHVDAIFMTTTIFNTKVS